MTDPTAVAPHPAEVDVKLASTVLPKGDRNGLAAHSSVLVRPENRKKLWIALAILSVPSITEDTDVNRTTAKVRLRRIELIVDPEDANDLERMLMRAFERRTGAAVLPLELEQEVELAFNGLDPDAIAREMAQAADEKAAAETNAYLAERERTLDEQQRHESQVVQCPCMWPDPDPDAPDQCACGDAVDEHDATGQCQAQRTIE